MLLFFCTTTHMHMSETKQSTIHPSIYPSRLFDYVMCAEKGAVHKEKKVSTFRKKILKIFEISPLKYNLTHFAQTSYHFEICWVDFCPTIVFDFIFLRIIVNYIRWLNWFACAHFPLKDHRFIFLCVVSIFFPFESIKHVRANNVFSWNVHFNFFFVCGCSLYSSYQKRLIIMSLDVWLSLFARMLNNFGFHTNKTTLAIVFANKKKHQILKMIAKHQSYSIVLFVWWKFFFRVYFFVFFFFIRAVDL